MDPVEVSETEAYQREVVLIQQDCLRRTGLLAFSGQLTLSSHRIRFEPKGALDRLVGAEELQIRIDEISEISYAKLEMVLNIHTRNAHHRFSGHGARRVNRRLYSLLNERAGKTHLKSDFQGDERIIVYDFGNLKPPREDATKGEFLLTDRRLRFQPTGRLERSFEASSMLDVHLSQIRDFEYDARHKILVIEAGTVDLGEEATRYEISGGKTPEIHAHLAAWRHISEREDPEGAVDLGVSSHSVEGALHRGPLQTPGLITIGADSISFVPTGKLDLALLSAKVVQLPFDEVCSVAIKGWPSARIFIRGVEQELELSTEQQDKWFAKLLEEMEDWLDKRTTIEDEEEVLGSGLASWRFAVERDALEETAFSIPAIHHSSAQEFRCGILAQTRPVLRFAPIHPSKNEEMLEVPVSEISREYTERKQDHQIRFRAFRSRYTFTPSGGRKAVLQFWSKCRIPARVLRGSQLRRHGYSRLTGAGSFIRLTSSMGSVVESQPTWILAHTDGIGVVAPGASGKSRFPGQNLSIEIRRHDGVYGFDTVALWAELLPASIKLENRAEFHLLIVEAPDEVRIYNERRTFRVPTLVEVRAYEMVKFNPEGVEIPTEELEAIRDEMPIDERTEDNPQEWTFGLGTFLAKVRDLSAEGCGIETDDPMIVGLRVSLDLTVEGRMLSLHGRVVWVSPPSQKGLPYQAGLEFQSLNQDQTNALTKVVMQLQRENLGEES